MKPRIVYSVVNGQRVINQDPQRPRLVQWRRKGCPTCKPIVVETRSTAAQIGYTPPPALTGADAHSLRGASGAGVVENHPNP